MSRWKWRRPIAILGCGPAGIFAAHALRLAGHPFTIFSNKRRSEMFGAQYLHAPIPGLSGSPFSVDYQLWGTLEGYVEKVYGDPNIKGSPGDLVGTHDAWDIRDAYYKGWDLYKDHIVHMPNIDPRRLHQITEEYGKGKRVISTLPAKQICEAGMLHQFHFAEVWAIGDAPERGIECPIRMPDDTVVCNGNREPAWYRAATILGYSTAEWPNRPPYEGAARVIKPTSTNCDCWPNVLRLGRYGSWTKGVLSHQAYYKVAEELQ